MLLMFNNNICKDNNLLSSYLFIFYPQHSLSCVCMQVADCSTVNRSFLRLRETEMFDILSCN